MRTPIIAGNWKMNMTNQEAVSLVNKICQFKLDPSVEVVVAAPFTALSDLQKVLFDKTVALAAQNMYYEENGAYTGEISPNMLKELSVKYVILGHSERRQIFLENDEVINKKLKSALHHKIIPILCCGEDLDQREEGQAESVVQDQLKKDLHELTREQIASLIIAYEPIWAIGTGKTASSQDAESMCRFIRDYIREAYDEGTAESVRIQYGGSVKPENIDELMHMPNIDGALVGGASLKADSFEKLVNFK